MFEELIEHVIAEMRNNLIWYCENAQVTERTKRGRIGEFFIGQSMKLILLEYLSHRPEESPCRFWIRPQYGKAKGHLGVDFKVDIRDAEGQIHTFLVESKNFRDSYPLTRTDFLEDILTRFTPYDPEHRWHWMVTLNHRHIDNIGWLCHAAGIEIIPLDIVFSRRPDIKELTDGVRAFTTRFIELVEVYVDFQRCLREDPTTIRHFIIRGVPDRIITRYLDVEISYVRKIKSEMRHEGEHTLDRRTKYGRDERGI